MSDLGTVSAPLDFDAVEAEDKQLMKAITDWPLWVQVGALWIEKTLEKVGLTIDINPASPDEYLHKLIALVEASPSVSPYKWLAIAALKWIDKQYLHKDHAMLKAFAKYAGVPA